MAETPRYRRGIDPMPDGVYQENKDGTYSPVEPIPLIGPKWWFVFSRHFPWVRIARLPADPAREDS